MIAAMDEGIGNITTVLRNNDMMDNSIIVYTSDVSNWLLTKDFISFVNFMLYNNPLKLSLDSIYIYTYTTVYTCVCVCVREKEGREKAKASVASLGRLDVQCHQNNTKISWSNIYPCAYFIILILYFRMGQTLLVVAATFPFVVARPHFWKVAQDRQQLSTMKG